jgi:hypothetical protein
MRLFFQKVRLSFDYLLLLFKTPIKFFALFGVGKIEREIMSFFCKMDLKNGINICMIREYDEI